MGKEETKEVSDMNGDSDSVRPERAQRILSVLGMPKTVPIMRYMHMNGWFEVSRLGKALELESSELLTHLEAMEKVDLIERNDSKFRLNRKMPELNLAKIATEVGPFLKCVKFYTNLVFNTLDKANDLDPSLYENVKDLVITTNGWKDQRAKAVLSCYDFSGGALVTYDNFTRMVAEGVLDGDDIHILKKVSLTMLVVLISNIEAATDRNFGRLLLRVGSKEVLTEFGPELERYALLESLPEEYFRQVC